MEPRIFTCRELIAGSDPTHTDCVRLSELPVQESVETLTSAQLNEALAFIYGFPNIADASIVYGIGFALTFLPWLISWAFGKVMEAIQLIN